MTFSSGFSLSGFVVMLQGGSTDDWFTFRPENTPPGVSLQLDTGHNHRHNEVGVQKINGNNASMVFMGNTYSSFDRCLEREREMFYLTTHSTHFI